MTSIISPGYSFEIPRIFVLGNVICIFVKNLVNVGKKLETKLQYIDTYLHNKNVLEYGLLLVDSGRFMIFHIEGRSNIFDNYLVIGFLSYSHSSGSYPSGIADIVASPTNNA